MTLNEENVLDLCLSTTSASPVTPVLEHTHRTRQKITLSTTPPCTAFLFAHQHYKTVS